MAHYKRGGTFATRSLQRRWHNPVRPAEVRVTFLLLSATSQFFSYSQLRRSRHSLTPAFSPIASTVMTKLMPRTQFRSQTSKSQVNT